jgi:phosphomannomutase/phosphoglucomutase
MTEGPVTSRRFSRRLIRQALLAGIGVIAVLVAVVIAIHLYQSARESAVGADRERAEAEVKALAEAVAAPFSAIGESLANLAVDPALIALFEAGDPAVLADAADARAGQFAHALRLRLLRPGRYAIEPDAAPPLSYASLDLLGRAERTTGSVGAEAHLVGSAGAHIVLIRSTRNKAGQVIGLLHLSLDVALFEEALEGLPPVKGLVELRQPTGDRAVILGRRGGGAAAGDPVVAAVPGTRWTVAYWPGSAVAAPIANAGGDGSPPVILLGGGALAMLFVVGIAVWMRRRGAAASGDEADMSAQVTYAGAVKAIMEGVHPGMEQLVPNLPRLGQVSAIRPVSQGMIGDDITMIARKSDLPGKPGGKRVPAASRATAPAAAKPAPAAVKSAPSAVPPAPASAAEAAAGSLEISPDIFRAYDIRGVVGKTLTEDVMRSIGRAIGSEAAARGVQKIAVGRDGRRSSPEFAQSLIKGLTAAGRDVIDIGMVPTPLLYFATHTLDVQGGVMVTGSHNGPEYNGVKIVLGDETLSGDAIRGLLERIREGRMESGSGDTGSADVVAAYIRRIAEDIPVALGGAFRIVVDCGNGVAGAVAPQLLRALGHDVLELYCEVDGTFPNHHPDPSQPENLQALVAAVRDEAADLGLAFDGDGDRLGVVDGGGNIIWPDRQLMLLAQDVLSRNAGAPVIYDVKCSRHLHDVIEAAGGRPVMWRTGHSLIKAKMKELDAPLAGELSGHVFFKERWYGFDDGMYAAARLVEVLMKAKKKPAEVFAALPASIATPELRVALPESGHAQAMKALAVPLAGGSAKVIDIDGLRVEFADGWGLVRPSNTSPALILRFEADTAEALQRIQETFRTALRAVSPDLKLPF